MEWAGDGDSGSRRVVWEEKAGAIDLRRSSGW